MMHLRIHPAIRAHIIASIPCLAKYYHSGCRISTRLTRERKTQNSRNSCNDLGRGKRSSDLNIFPSMLRPTLFANRLGLLELLDGKKGSLAAGEEHGTYGKE